MIRSPYNFIPLSDKVFFPDWADQISHDVPFSDGVSGKITLEIEAQTPIFVRNGHAGNEVDNSFSRTNDNRYFIPGTSIKGAIRNVLEIISHGKMRTYKNRLFAQREWDNKELYNLKSKQTSFRCGWLRWDKENGYHIVDCGKPCRIGHDRIDEYLGDEVFKNKFSKSRGIDLNRPQRMNGIEFDPKTARYKYALIDDLHAILDDLSFTTDTEHNSSQGGGFHRVKVTAEANQEFRGTIVFTGQPDKWVYPRPKELQKGAGKFYDFVFKNPSGDPALYKINDDDFEMYQSIYKDSPDWQYWYDKLYSTGIPVFFMEERGKKMKWGLALLFKLPYDHTPFDTLSDIHKENEYDLADCIFGTVDKDKSLKGRVIFGHAFCNSENVVPMDDVRLILSSPKASYYPTYIAQDGKNGVTAKYKTYNDGRISGWKRYVVKETVSAPIVPVTVDGRNVSDRVYTTMKPLPENSRFTSDIIFHNLKPEELGALLSALTFHGHPNCFHQLGQGKPYGYGRVSIVPTLKVYAPEYRDFDKETFMAQFESVLRKDGKSVNVGRLIIMASSLRDGSRYEYMNLSMDRDGNEFQNSKNQKLYLELDNVSSVNSWSSIRKNEVKDMCELSKQVKAEYEAKLELAAKEAERQRELEEQLRQEQEMAKLAMEQLKSEADLLLANNNYAEALSKYQEIFDRTNDETVLSKIETCKLKLESQIAPLSEYLKDLKVSSIPAFANGLEKKWMQPNNRTSLDNAEIDQLVKFLSDMYSGLSAKDKKKWSIAKDWKKLHDLVKVEIFAEIVK